MREQWDALKEAVIELRDNNGTLTQQEVCQFLANLMNVLEAQMEPERKTGKWIEDNDSIVHGHCLRCGWPAIWQETDVFGMNFCPNCGAQMDEEEPETPEEDWYKDEWRDEGDEDDGTDAG